MAEKLGVYPVFDIEFLISTQGKASHDATEGGPYSRDGNLEPN